MNTNNNTAEAANTLYESIETSFDIPLHPSILGFSKETLNIHCMSPATLIAIRSTPLFTHNIYSELVLNANTLVCSQPTDK